MNGHTERFDGLYIGPYVDKPGAVMLLGGQITHLTPQQCLRLAQKLTDCAGPAETPRRS